MHANIHCCTFIYWIQYKWTYMLRYIACQKLPDYLWSSKTTFSSCHSFFFSGNGWQRIFVSCPILRPDHPDHVFMDVEEIMSMMIKESDGISMELLNILISSVKKENQVLLLLYNSIHLSLMHLSYWIFNEVVFWFRMFHLAPIC